MRKDQVQIGQSYLAKVSNNVVTVRIDTANPRGGWDATNLATNKSVRIKSAQRLRGPAPQRQSPQAAVPTTPQRDAQRDEHRSAEQDAQAVAAAASAPQTPQTAKALKVVKARKTSGLDAAHQMLAEAGQPMRCGDLVEKMLSSGRWKTGGKTPAATIYSAIVREIATKGSASRFKKTDRGLFATNA